MCRFTPPTTCVARARTHRFASWRTMTMCRMGRPDQRAGRCLGPANATPTQPKPSPSQKRALSYRMFHLLDQKGRPMPKVWGTTGGTSRIFCGSGAQACACFWRTVTIPNACSGEKQPACLPLSESLHWDHATPFWFLPHVHLPGWFHSPPWLLTLLVRLGKRVIGIVWDTLTRTRRRAHLGSLSPRMRRASEGRATSNAASLVTSHAP